MKNCLITLVAVFFCLQASAQNNIERKPLPKEVQIKIALQAAPESLREGAKVYGYDEEGKFVVLQEPYNNNKTVCLAPDYKMSTYYAYAYPQSLDPFMERGRQLIAEGKRAERDQIREQEIKEGKLEYPLTPTVLYGYWGDVSNLNIETGEIKDAKRRYVFYMPYAMAEDIGLPNKGNNLGMPWLMDEGSYKSHIMITPPSGSYELKIIHQEIILKKVKV